MKPVELVSVCVRFFAVNLVLMGLSMFLQTAQSIRNIALTSPGASNSATFLLGGFVVALVSAAAMVFWLYPLPVARFFVPKGVESELSIAFSAEQFEVCLLSLLGVWVLVTALPQAIRLGIWMLAIEVTPPESLSQRWTNLAYWIIQIALGALLVLRAGGIRRIVHQLRTAGS